MGQHKDISGQDIHIIHRWVVADATARLALSVGPADVGKVCKQESPLSWWILSDDSPLTWVQLDTDGGPGTDHDALSNVTANQHHAQLHSASHGPGQPDALKLDDLDSPDDNTDLNTSTSAHGLAPKLDNDGNHYLDGQGNWTTPPGSGGGFGEDYQSAESLAESSTSLDTWQTKLQLVVPARTGTYRIGWSARCWHSNTLDSYQVRLYNVTDDEVVSGYFDEEAENSTNRRPVGGFANVAFTGAGKTFEIQYRQDRGGTAYINQARMEFWKVGA